MLLPGRYSRSSSEIVPRQQLPYAVVQGAPAQRVAVIQPFVQCRHIAARTPDAEGDDGLDLGAKCETGRIAPVVHRFDAHPVAHQPKFLLQFVVDGKCEHAVEVPQRCHAAVRKRFEYDLGVGTRVKAAHAPLSGQFPKVVDLAVVGDYESVVRRLHGLRTRARQIQDAEPHMPQPEISVPVDSAAVRSAVMDALQCAAKPLRRQTILIREPNRNAEDSTHGLTAP